VPARAGQEDPPRRQDRLARRDDADAHRTRARRGQRQDLRRGGRRGPARAQAVDAAVQDEEARRPVRRGAAVTRGPRIAIIVGPTASGKSDLALRLAEAAGGEIVSADSQQVYAGLDIGTGKVTAAERARVRHHLVDVVPAGGTMTAARFAELADAAIADIAGRGRAPIV